MHEIYHDNQHKRWAKIGILHFKKVTLFEASLKEKTLIKEVILYKVSIFLIF